LEVSWCRRCSFCQNRRCALIRIFEFVCNTFVIWYMLQCKEWYYGESLNPLRSFSIFLICLRWLLPLDSIIDVTNVEFYSESQNSSNQGS
jgi:hypothetical protein